MADLEEGAACAIPQEGAMSEDDKASSDVADDNVTLSFLDKLKCMMYSKVERDAFLIEKLEKEEKKKAKKMAQASGDKNKGKEPKKNKVKSSDTSDEQRQLVKRPADEIEVQQRIQSSKEGATVTPGDTVAKPQ